MYMCIMYIHSDIYMYAHIYVCVHTYRNMCAHTCVCIYVSKYISEYMYALYLCI